MVLIEAVIWLILFIVFSPIYIFYVMAKSYIEDIKKAYSSLRGAIKKLSMKLKLTFDRLI